MMRSTFATLAFGLLTAAATFATSRADAEPEFDVSVAGTKITVVTKGSWHINKAYPWKLTVGDAKLDKSKFAMSETQASLADAPKGAAVLKGGICAGNECRTFEKQLTLR
jgi:hypothetical protein